ncbi:MAG: DUF29 family protein [Stellaceae bacterium]
MHDGPRYEDDFYAWTQHQAAVLCSLPVADTRFDREHDARQTLSDKISPSLRRDAETALDKLYADARKRAAAGLGQYGEPDASAALPRTCPFSLDEICPAEWYPARPGATP